MRLEDLNIKDIAGITQDSRLVKKGYLFAALPGAAADGADYINQAIQNGADHILSGESVEPLSGVHHVRVKNPRQAFAQIAAVFYGIQPEHIVAVTGTNGKSSVVEFTRQIWAALGLKGGAMGTLGLQSDVIKIDGNMTTPETVKLHDSLKRAAQTGLSHLAMEASSHGLDQYRMHGVRLSAAGYTNLSHDHLDYHGCMERYFQAKAKLFAEILPKGCVAVLNADDARFDDLKQICETRGIRITEYGRRANDLKILDITPRAQGQHVRIQTAAIGVFEFDTPLSGEFQIYNLLCAAGLALAEVKDEDGDGRGVLVKDVLDTLGRVSGVRGRIEAVQGHPQGAGVYVDYAHTPDALEKVLQALRAHVTGRLFCVFGCGGDRDKAKRPEMGAIAHNNADIVIVTDDNPRSENADDIRAQILAAVPDGLNIGSRDAAIQYAVNSMQGGDVLLVAGKGHEQGQVFADHVADFDDVTAVKKAFKHYNKKKEEEGK